MDDSLKQYEYIEMKLAEASDRGDDREEAFKKLAGDPECADLYRRFISYPESLENFRRIVDDRYYKRKYKILMKTADRNNSEIQFKLGEC